MGLMRYRQHSEIYRPRRYDRFLRRIFFGWQHLSRKSLAVIRQQCHDRILQNSSVLSFAALRFHGACNATKFALEGLSDNMRLECHGNGNSIVPIEPGPITTRIRENSIPHFERWISLKNSASANTYEKFVISCLIEKKSKKTYLNWSHMPSADVLSTPLSQNVRAFAIVWQQLQN